MICNDNMPLLFFWHFSDSEQPSVTHLKFNESMSVVNTLCLPESILSFSGWHVSRANIDCCSLLRLIDIRKRVVVLKVPHLFHFALTIVLLLPSSVNSSTLHELGAGEHRRDERDRGRERESWVGELDWATLSSVDLLRWSCPSTHAHTDTHRDTHAQKNTSTCMHVHTHTHQMKCSAHPLSPWLRPSNWAASRAPLHFR